MFSKVNISRREFILSAAKTASAIVAGGVLSSCVSSEYRTEPDTIKKLPNILVLMADDWAWPGMSRLSMPQAKTPTLDMLSREGVFFTNAHCSAPSCSPSRAAMLTGKYPFLLEQGANLKTYLPKKFRTYPEILADYGYHVGSGGKGYGPGLDGGRGYNPAGPQYAPSEKYKDGFDAFLAMRKPGQPFCYWFGSLNPHRPYKWRSGREKGINPDQISVPPFLPDNEIIREDIADYLGEVYDFDKECARHIETLKKTGEFDNTIIVITGDNGMPFPRCKSNLYMTGTHVPLIIMWPAAVKGGAERNEIVTLADLAPTFLEAAGIDIPSDMTGRSLLPMLIKSSEPPKPRDFALTAFETHFPTARDIGQGMPGGYPMRSIITKDFHLIWNFKHERWPAGDPRGMDATKPTYPFSYEQISRSSGLAFADCDASPTKAFMLLNRFSSMETETAWNRAFAKRQEFELYDLRNDPYELANLAENADYKNVFSELKQILENELKKVKDPRILGDGDKFDLYNIETIDK